MLVTYKVNPVTAAIGQRLLNVTSASLPNLLSRRHLVPELLQHWCTPDAIAAEITGLLTDPAKRDRQLAGFDDIRLALHSPDGSPSEAAAAMVLEEAAIRRAAD
jgi:lipid-A-disaccharide synthase